MSERIGTSNLEDYLKEKILDGVLDNRNDSTRIFHYGIVVNNVDPKNCNRIQVRIPQIDDSFYTNTTLSAGNAILPWCSPFSRNFIGTPETNSLVLVAIFDPGTPYFGRIFFDAITDLNDTDIFDHTRLTPEVNTYNNWGNLEGTHNVFLKTRPKVDNQYNVQSNVSYPMGIRGKGYNRITLGQESTEIYQNEGRDNQSMLTFTNNVTLQACNHLNLLSTNGTSTKYHPLFDQPNYKHMRMMMDMMRSIVQVMCSNPSLAPNTTPNLPSPDAFGLVTPLTNLYANFAQLIQPANGASDQLFIN